MKQRSKQFLNESTFRCNNALCFTVGEKKLESTNNQTITSKFKINRGTHFHGFSVFQ